MQEACGELISFLLTIFLGGMAILLIVFLLEVLKIESEEKKC